MACKGWKKIKINNEIREVHILDGPLPVAADGDQTIFFVGESVSHRNLWGHVLFFWVGAIPNGLVFHPPMPKGKGSRPVPRPRPSL
jgi:hypothetical protein